MTSQAMQSRLQAQSTAAAGDAPSADAGDATSGLGADETDVETPVVETSASEGAATSAAPSEPETPEQAEARVARAKRLELFDEKLKTARERRHASRLAERASADRMAAKAERESAATEREAAAAERARLAEGKRDYKKFFEANGMDANAAYQDMTRQALEAGTPEAQIKRLQEDWKVELQKFRDAEVAPLKQELEQERAHRADLAKQNEEHRLSTNFASALGDPAFRNLRIEYPDEALLGHVRNMIQNPALMYETARIRQVPLTNPQKGFTMQEILKVLAAEQAAHDQGKQARQAAQSPAEPQSAQPTVNGTAPRRNAGTAIGNVLASERAAAKAEVPSLSPKEKLRQRQAAEIRRGSS